MEKKHSFSFRKKEKLVAYEDEKIHELHKQLKAKVEAQKKREKKEAKPEIKEPKIKVPFKKKFVNFWFGIDKEVHKIVWVTGRRLITIFLLILLVSAILVGLFFGINQLFIYLGVFRN